MLRGTAQNPDVFFQAREAANPFYDAVPGHRQQDDGPSLPSLTGRQYQLFDYVGAPDAERVVVMMGSGVGAAEEAVAALVDQGEKVGLVKVRLYRPFATDAFLAALPPDGEQIAVLDRTKEPGALGEPLYQDVVTALVEGWDGRANGRRQMPTERHRRPIWPFVQGIHPGHGGTRSSTNWRPKSRKRHFTIGIIDDVTHLSLKWDPEFNTESDDVTRAVFYGLGSDGTVGASKNSVKIIGENTPLYAQGYFVYDSKKAGSVTVSHVRFSPRPIESTYLIERANFVACHQFNFLERIDVLKIAEPGATFLLNSPYGPDEVWDQLPQEVQAADHRKEA